MDSFYLNGYLWRVIFVDPRSSELVDRTGKRTVATTDPKTGYIYLSKSLSGSFLTRVLIHELCHCAMISFNLLEHVHRMVKPSHWVEAEEWICNFLADYGIKIFSIAYDILGSDAIRYVLYELERLVA